MSVNALFILTVYNWPNFVVVIMISLLDVNTRALFPPLKNISMLFVPSYDTEIRLDLKLGVYRILLMETLLVFLSTLVLNLTFPFPMISNVESFSANIPKYSLLRVV